jgi:hypothetical protein
MEESRAGEQEDQGGKGESGLIDVTEKATKLEAEKASRLAQRDPGD